MNKLKFNLNPQSKTEIFNFLRESLKNQKSAPSVSSRVSALEKAVAELAITQSEAEK